MATVRIDDSLHQKMKEIAKKNKSQSIAKEYENALKQYIENERQNEILIDSQIENLMNKKLDKIDKHLASYIGKLDKNIYRVFSTNLLMLRSIRDDLYEKYSEEQLIQFLNHKGEMLNKSDAIENNKIKP
ncbi:MAG: hypothetical protein E6X43_12525 [Peptostreptococcaceae bacterium]|nr:hypothetical protein [Peptostreptococcaceae bacterium]